MNYKKVDTNMFVQPWSYKTTTFNIYLFGTKFN